MAECHQVPDNTYVLPVEHCGGENKQYNHSAHIAGRFTNYISRPTAAISSSAWVLQGKQEWKVLVDAMDSDSMTDYAHR